jgi:LPXTG-motif cell wall-anchored protein
MAVVLTRLHELVRHKGFGRPQPPPQPEPQPFDVVGTVSGFAPWLLLGSAVLLGGAGLLSWRRRQAQEAERTWFAEHRAGARAFAKIGDLGARILAAEQDGGTADPAAAERHATALTLFDQAKTAEAMAEVERIADEGLALEGAK